MDNKPILNHSLMNPFYTKAFNPSVDNVSLLQTNARQNYHNPKAAFDIYLRAEIFSAQKGNHSILTELEFNFSKEKLFFFYK